MISILSPITLRMKSVEKEVEDKTVMFKSNELTVEILNYPSVKDVVSSLEQVKLQCQLHTNGSILLTINPEVVSSLVDFSSLKRTIIERVRQFSGCWLRLMEPGRLISRTVGMRFSLHFGSFFDRHTFINRGVIGNCQGHLSTNTLRLSTTENYLIDFVTTQLQDFILVDESTDSVSVYLTFRTPPRVVEQQDVNSVEINGLRVAEMKLPDGTVFSKSQFSKSRTIRLVVDASARHSLLQLCQRLEREMYHCKIQLTEAADYECLCVEESQIPKYPNGTSWDVNLAWFCVMSTSGFVAERFTEQFFNQISAFTERLVVRGLYCLARRMERDHFINPCDFVRHFPDVYLSKRHTEQMENAVHDCKVPRLVLTPTRCIFFEPEISKSNRVLRSWSGKTHFLRVSIRDENLDRLSLIHGSIHPILENLFAHMEKGFDFVGKKFRFLGCSNSQARDHGCFYVDESSLPGTAQNIRLESGNIQSVKNVAKYVSRLGQVFSTSTKTVELKNDECEHIADIERNGYTFTDGIGKISPKLAKEMAEKLERCQGIPCAFQIRFGGCKGVVAVSTDMHETHPGKKLLFRRSMNKYWCNDTAVEVLPSYARPQELFLNQQLVMLLSHLSVPDEVFLKLLKDHLVALSKMFVDEQCAKEKLGALDCGMKWTGLFQTQHPVTSDPFFRSMLKVYYGIRIRALRERARIPIDPSHARVLLGTVDETATLQYGQVFIQISQSLQHPGEEKRILEQTVVVGKSPCLHPGDVRTFEAIDVPKLHHMCDCIVFPSEGSRPHPNELSGSDLDGDLYHTIWHPDLLPRVPNKEPMTYSSAVVPETHEVVSVNDMLSFFRANIELDTIGHIANLHKALADQQGLDSDACLELAKLHSLAVDAPKTGQWVDIPPRIRNQLQKYPDFMMKEDKLSYPSEKVLGVMYRECVKLFTSTKHSNLPESCHVPCHVEMPGSEEFMEEARKLRGAYNAGLLEIMMMYGVETEAELISGLIVTLHKKTGKESNALADVISNLKYRLLSYYKGLFLKDTDANSDDEDRKLCKAVAWYNVCYDPNEECETFQIGKQKQRLLSFAWIGGDYLIKVFQKVHVPFLEVRACFENEMVLHCLQSKSQILNQFRDHVKVKNEIHRVLVNRGYAATLYGLSYTLLFDTSHPEVEMLIQPIRGQTSNHTNNKQHFHEDPIQSIRTILEGYKIQSKIIKRGGNSCLRFRMLSQKKLRKLDAHIVMDSDMMIKSRMLLEYIYYHPWLWIPLSVLMKWMRSQEFIGLSKNSCMDCHIVCFFFIQYCIERNFISILNTDEIIGDDFDGFANVEVWEKIFDRIQCEFPCCLGDLLLSFFSQYKPEEIHSSLCPIFNTHRHYTQITTLEAMNQLEDEMHRAYHNLSFHGTIESLFTPSVCEKIVSLPLDWFSKSHGAFLFLQRWLRRKTGVHIETFLKRKEAHGVLMRIVGSYRAIYCAEKELENLQQRNAILVNARVHFPGSLELWLPDCRRFIIEGVQNEEELVHFEEYWEPRHPEDDLQTLYILKVVDTKEKIPQTLYDWKSEKFLQFKKFFLERWAIMAKSYDAAIHGSREMRISFGRLYVISPSVECLESTNGIHFAKVLEMLKEESQKDYVLDIVDWKQKLKGKAKERTTLGSNGEYKPSRKACFFPKFQSLLSRADIEEIFRNYGLINSLIEDYYEINLHGAKCGITAKYGMDLKLISVNYPPLKWMLVDLKRFHDAYKELDIRFELRSQPEGDQMLEKDLGTALSTSGSASDPIVSKNVMSRVHTLCMISRKAYHYPKNDKFWNWVTIVSDEMMVKSRPNHSDHNFGSEDRLFELSFVLDLKKIGLQEFPDHFIGEIWFQAMYFSDVVHNSISLKAKTQNSS